MCSNKFSKNFIIKVSEIISANIQQVFFFACAKRPWNTDFNNVGLTSQHHLTMLAYMHVFAVISPCGGFGEQLYFGDFWKADLMQPNVIFRARREREYSRAQRLSQCFCSITLRWFGGTR